MINQTLLWLLLLPVVLGILLWYFNRTREDAIPAAVLFGFGAVMIIGACFLVSKGGATNDIEIWNGQVTAKNRKEDTYEQAYDCRCRTITTYVGTGKNRQAVTTTKCDTCYQTHYTVKWSCDTSVGEFSIAKEDDTSRRIYSTPDPELYRQIVIGEPASARRTYTNYVQAVPESLFTPSAASLKAKFSTLIPAYPDKIYSLFKNNHVVTAGLDLVDIDLWNKQLAEALRDIGPQKQVNAIIVVVKTDDPNYEYAIRDAWEGANKNDVVVLIGTTDFPTISWVRIISWTKNEEFKVQLRDRIAALGTIHRDKTIAAIHDQIATNFERRHMSDFAYLDGEIDPPTWLIMTLIVLVLIGAGGLHWFMHYHQGSIYPRFNRFRT